MAERNYPVDNMIDVYFGTQPTSYFNSTGEAVFKKQLYQSMLAQAAHRPPGIPLLECLVVSSYPAPQIPLPRSRSSDPTPQIPLPRSRSPDPALPRSRSPQIPRAHGLLGAACKVDHRAAARE